MKLGEIAKQLGCEVDGDASLEITGVAGIEEAEPGELTFFVNRKYRPALETTRASAVFVAKDAGPVRIAALRSANPYLDFARAIEIFHPAPRYTMGIHPTAIVAKTAKIAPGAHVGPYCFVDEDVEIGRNAVLHSFVAIYRGAKIGDDFFAHSRVTVRENCRIGNRVLLQNGVTIGSDGFGFARQHDGTWHKIRQSGIAVIEDDVEIQAHSCDRSRHGRRDAHRARNQDRQSGAGRSRVQSRRGHAAVRPSGPRRHYQGRQSLHSRRASGRCGTFDDRRWSDAHRAIGCADRRAGGCDLFGLSGDGQSGVAKIGGGFQSLAGAAEGIARTARDGGEIELQGNRDAAAIVRGGRHFSSLQRFLIFRQASGNQILYPLAQFVALIHRVSRGVDWRAEANVRLRRDGWSSRLCASGAGFPLARPEPPARRRELPSRNVPFLNGSKRPSRLRVPSG